MTNFYVSEVDADALEAIKASDASYIRAAAKIAPPRPRWSSPDEALSATRGLFDWPSAEPPPPQPGPFDLPEAAPRGYQDNLTGDFSNPFLAMQAQQAESRFSTNAAMGPVAPDVALAHAMGPLSAFGTLLSDKQQQAIPRPIRPLAVAATSPGTYILPGSALGNVATVGAMGTAQDYATEGAKSLGASDALATGIGIAASLPAAALTHRLTTPALTRTATTAAAETAPRQLGLGLEFKLPDVATRVATATAERELAGAPASEVTATLRAVNGMFRGLNAMGDISYAGTQGAVGLFSNPREYGRAFVTSLKAWRNPEVQAAYLEDYAQRVAAKGAIDPEEWVRAGLRVAGPDTEFAVGQGLGRVSSTVQRLPGVAASNRAFGAFGDALRLEMADALADEARLAGRSLDASTLASIAKTANRMTGISSNPRRLGEWGDLLTFAPSYFQGKIESVLQLASGDAFERALARRTVGRFIGLASATTVALNETLGNETDFRPVVEINGHWQKNSNFLRVRALGRDWTLLGPYDSLLGLGINIATGNVSDVARSTLTAPTISRAWDIIAGRTITGESTRDTTDGALLGGLNADTLRYMAMSLLPFSADALGEAKDAALAGKPGEVVGGVLSGAGGFRGSPLSVTDRLDEASAGGDFYALTKSEQQKILDANPTLAEEQRDARLNAGGLTGKVAGIREDFTTQQADLDQQHASGTLSDAAYYDATHDRLDQQSEQIKGAYAGEPKSLSADPIMRDWFEALRLAKQADGAYDRGAIAAYRSSLSAADIQHISDNGAQAGTAPAREIQEFDRQLEASGFWAAQDRAWQVAQRADPSAKEYASRRDWEQAMLARFRERVGRGKLAGSLIADDIAAEIVSELPAAGLYAELLPELRQVWAVRNQELATQAVKYGVYSSGPTTDVGGLLRAREFVR